LRLTHFETLKPICPRCKCSGNRISDLQLAHVYKELNAIILEGIIACSNQQCSQHYPIIQGVPILMPNLNEYVKNNLFSISTNHNLNPNIESILGDASGARSEYNNIRHFLSTYCWDHYGDLAPENEFSPQPKPHQSEIANLLNTGLALFRDTQESPQLDIGCAVGRSTFSLADKTPGLTLGIDINFSNLLIGQQILLNNQIQFPLKQYGVAFQSHNFEVSFEHQHFVDFWACNALAMPFRDESFSCVSALNVLDVVPHPHNFLFSANNILAKNGSFLFSSPYDWSPPVNLENWIGGKGMNGLCETESDELLRQYFSTDSRSGTFPKLKMIDEVKHHPWKVRIHKRRTVNYDVHIIAGKKEI